MESRLHESKKGPEMPHQQQKIQETENPNQIAVADNSASQQELVNEAEEGGIKSIQNAESIIKFETEQIILAAESEKAQSSTLREMIARSKWEQAQLTELINKESGKAEQSSKALKISQQEMLQAIYELQNTNEIVNMIEGCVKSLQERSSNNHLIVSELKRKITEEINSFEEMKTQYTGEIQRVERDISELQAAVAEAQRNNINTEWKNKIDLVKRQIEEMEKVKAKAIAERETIRAKFLEIEEEKSKKRTELQEIQSRVEDRKRALAEAQENKRRKAEQRAAKKQELLQILNESEEKLQQMREQNENSSEQIHTKLEHLNDLRKRRLQLEEELDDLNSTIEREAEEHKERKEAKEAILSQLERDLKDKEGEEKVLKDKRQHLEEELREAQEVICLMYDDRTREVTKHSEAQSTINKKLLACIEEKHKLDLNKEKLAGLQGQFSKLEALSKDVESDILKETEDFEAQMKSKQTKYDQIAVDFTSKIEQVEKKIAYTKKSEDYILEEHKKLLVENDELKDEIGRQQIEMQSFTSMIDEKKRKRDEIQSKYKQLQAEYDKVITGVAKSQETEVIAEPPVSILKSPRKVNTPPKKVTFQGMSSFGSTTDSSAVRPTPSNKLKSFDELIEEMSQKAVSAPTSRTAKRRKSFQ